MTGLLWAALGILGGFGMAAIGDMVSEEVRDRLDHLPHAILRLAAWRLDPALRASLYEEVWLPDLAYHLKGDEARPVTRLYHGICFAAGMLASAHRSSRSLNGARPQDNMPSLPDIHDGVTNVAHAAKAVFAPLQLRGLHGLEVAISGNRLIVFGEIDILNVRAFGAALLELGNVPATTLILDIRGVSFMNVRSVGVLMDFAATLKPPRRVAVACSSSVARVLNIATTSGERASGQWSIITQ
jgi:anti-anti-sigma regulatory factor